MSMSQTEKILKHIEEHGGITPDEAIQQYRIFRLASRISDIKKRGFVVETEIVKFRNTNGEPGRYARYTIPELRKDMRV